MLNYEAHRAALLLSVASSSSICQSDFDWETKWYRQLTSAEMAALVDPIGCAKKKWRCIAIAIKPLARRSKPVLTPMH
jgi:hypothetical protein